MGSTKYKEKASFRLASISANRASSLGRGPDLRLQAILQNHQTYWALLRVKQHQAFYCAKHETDWRINVFRQATKFASPMNPAWCQIQLVRTELRGNKGVKLLDSTVGVCGSEVREWSSSLASAEGHAVHTCVVSAESEFAKATTIVSHSFQHYPGFAAVPERGSSTAHSLEISEINPVALDN